MNISRLTLSRASSLRKLHSSGIQMRASQQAFSRNSVSGTSSKKNVTSTPYSELVSNAKKISENSSRRKAQSSKRSNTSNLSMNDRLSLARNKGNYMGMQTAAKGIDETKDIFQKQGEDTIFTRAEKDGVNSGLIKEMKSFVSDYNDMIDKMKKVGGKMNTSYYSALSSVCTKNKDNLEKVGLKQLKDGSFLYDLGAMQHAAIGDIRQVFGKTDGFLTQVSAIAKKVGENAAESMKPTPSTNDYKPLVNAGNKRGTSKK